MTTPIVEPRGEILDWTTAKAAYEKRYQAWKDGGRVGPPPPYPIPPHTPGLKVPDVR